MWIHGILLTGGIPYRELRSRIPHETERFLWTARAVDRIKVEGRTNDFKAEGKQSNPYREKILDEVCTEAFGSTHPTKEGDFFKHGTVVARMFARGTQGRADLVRSLKTGPGPA